MIYLNGKKFAENHNEFIESLFSSPNTCVGYAKADRKGQVVLEDHQHKRVGVINAHGVLCHASKLENGRYWYCHADIKVIGKFSSYIKQIEECKAALKHFHNKAPRT